MGQTLTHGVYLPDEGERNCYSGLAANWQLLDSAVGTVAEHTSQIARKAPTVHTHTKADITDLFNSANTWTANNYFPLLGLYQKGFSPRASVPASNEFGQFGIMDTGNNAVMSVNYANRATGARDLTLRVYNNAGDANGVGVFKDANDNYSFCSLDPNNTINLGTSTNEWKTLNGVNPGALSLPSNIGYDPIDTRNWDLTGNPSSPNWYTPTVDGWLCVIALAGTMTDAWLDIWVDSLWGQSASQSPSGELFCIIPVRANLNVRIRVKASYIFDARLFVATGNV